MAGDLTDLTWAAWGLGVMCCALLAAVIALAVAVTRLQARAAVLEDAGLDWDLPGRDW